MIVNDTHRFIFVHTPKAAGSSLRQVLAPLAGARPDLRHSKTQHETLPEMMARLGLSEDEALPGAPEGSPPLSGYFRFCFVRNPWSRFLSLHRFLRAKYTTRWPVPETADELAILLGDGVEWVSGLHSVRPQSDFAAGTTFVGRYENLAGDMGVIGQQLGMALDGLGEHNSTGSFREDYRTAMSEQTAEFLAAHYAEDIARFSYSFA